MEDPHTFCSCLNLVIVDVVAAAAAVVVVVVKLSYSKYFDHISPPQLLPDHPHFPAYPNLHFFFLYPIRKKTDIQR